MESQQEIEEQPASSPVQTECEKKNTNTYLTEERFVSA